MSFKPYLVPTSGRNQINALKKKVKSSSVPAFYDGTVQDKASGQLYSAFTVDRHEADARRLLGKRAVMRPLVKSEVVGKNARFKVTRY